MRELQIVDLKEESMVIHQTKFLAAHPGGLTADFVRLTPMMAAPVLQTGIGTDN